MKNYFVTTLLVLLLSIPAIAQTATDIAGKWEFKEIIAPERADEKSKEMLSRYFKETSFDFNSNAQYSAAIMGRPDSGTWKVLEGKIELTSDTGEIYTLNIIEYKKDFLSVKLSKASFTMTKTSGVQHSSSSPAADNYITITGDRIAKKWFVVETESGKDMDPELKAAMLKLMQGSYIDLNRSGVYDVDMLGVAESGKWKLNDTKNGIIMESGGQQKLWHVLELCSEKLVMVLGNKEDKWYFSTKK